VLFVANNDLAVVLASPLALGLIVAAIVADLYLLRSLWRDWARKRQ
jgi:hypothetical protein